MRLRYVVRETILMTLIGVLLVGSVWLCQEKAEEQKHLQRLIQGVSR